MSYIVAICLLMSREAVLYKRWRSLDAKRQEDDRHPETAFDKQHTPVHSPIAARISKLLVQAGDIISDDDQALIELEAMKTIVSHLPIDGETDFRCKSLQETGRRAGRWKSWRLSQASPLSRIKRCCISVLGLRKARR